MTAVQKWLSADDRRRLDIQAKAQAKERLFLKSGRAVDDELELEIEEDEFIKEQDAKAKIAAAIANQLPIPTPPKYFQSGTEDESVSNIYVTSGTAKSAPLELRTKFPELAYHTTTRYGSTLIVFGGEDKEMKLRNDVYEINLVTKSVRLVVPDGEAPQERKGTAAARVGHRIWFFGGHLSSQARETNSPAVFALDLQKWEWVWPAGNRGMPSAMAFHSAVKLWDNRILLFGGQRQNHSILGNNCFVFDCDRQEFYAPMISGNSPKARMGHGAVMYQNKMIVFGGLGIESFSDVWYLDTQTWQWTGPIDYQGSFPSRSQFACERFGSKIIAFGGECAGYPLNDLRIYDLMTSTWKQKAYGGEHPDARKGHSGCMFGSTFVLVGGGKDEQARQDARTQFGFLFTKNYLVLVPTSEVLRIDLGPRVIQVPRSTLATDLLKLFREKHFADLVVESKRDTTATTATTASTSKNSSSNGQLFYAHRAIVLARAPKLFALIPKDKPKGSEYFRLDLLSNSSKSVQILLEYFYSDSVSPPDEYDRALMEEVRDLATRFDLPHLAQLVAAIMKRDSQTDQQQNTLSSSLASLLNGVEGSNLSDFVVRCGDRAFGTHRCILLSRSPYFRTLLQSGMIEAQRGEVSLHDVSADVFEMVLRFIFTDECVPDPERAVELLSVAGLLDLPRLRTLCESIIDMNFDFEDAENVLQLLLFADIHRSIHLISLCSYIITQVIGLKVAELTDAWKTLPVALKQKLQKAI